MQTVTNLHASTSPLPPRANMPPAWPLEVRAIFDALTSPAPISRERRKKPRTPCRVEAKLWPVNTAAPGGRAEPMAHSTECLPVYLRDYSAGAVSFVGQSSIPAEQLVDLEMQTTSGASKRTRCRVLRCRQFHEGWFEGVLVLAK